MFSVKRRPVTPIDSPYGSEDIMVETEPFLKRLANGDLDAIEPVVLGHARLAMKIAGGYYRAAIAQDLPSIAIMALFDGCLEIIKGHDCRGNLTGYLVSKVHSRCYRFYCEDRLLRVPMNMINKKGPVLLDKKADIYTLRAKKGGTSELIQTILDCCATTREKQIIRMKQYGFTNLEVAFVFGLTRQQIGNILRRIEKRFDKMQ
jgi:hypothetical protein